MFHSNWNEIPDPSQLLAEEGFKPPCPTFVQSGTCPHGTQCRFSHAPQYYPFKGNFSFLCRVMLLY
jgi:hypothetical protein